MDEVKYLLKFGEKQYLDSFANGNLYFSNAETFQNIENKQQNKGQGDILEAGTRIFAQNVVIESPNSNIALYIDCDINFLCYYKSVKKTPIFCLFAVFEDDCCFNDNGQNIINLSIKKQRMIKEHFPKANAVAIISNPSLFLKDVENSIGEKVLHEKVHYFKIDKGYEGNANQKVHMDNDYMKYLAQDTSIKNKNGNKTFTLDEKYAYRALFCKDEYFKEQQEYRIILPNIKIEKSTIYPVTISEAIKVVSLDDFFK